MKHERAAIMALTFCIGFTTGLIAYGLPEAEPEYTTKAPQVASVAPGSSIKLAERDTTSSIRTETDETGLYYIKGTVRTLVAPTVAYAGAIPEAYTDAHAVSVSPDGMYVFFCAETTSQPNSCAPRVFDVAGFAVHGVTQAGIAQAQNPSTLNATWSGDHTLTLNGRSTVVDALPWVVE